MKDKRTLAEQDSYSFADLIDIVAVLRAPDGCPWDREQTHASIRSNLLEEAYEAAEAIDENDPVHLREELGDVLLQVLMHARMDEESGLGGIDGICDALAKKLVFRHPHVFGEIKVKNSSEVLAVWDSVKAESRGEETVSARMKSVSKALPALTAAHKIGRKGSKAGFDFSSANETLEKVHEELRECESALGKGDSAALNEELGDLYLALTCFARQVGVDSEEALRTANTKFISRFAEVEKLCAADNIAVGELDSAKKAEYWRKAKKISDNT